MFVSHVLPIAAVLTSLMLPPPADPRQGTDSLREYKAVSRFLRMVDEYVMVQRLADPLEPDAMCLPDQAYAAVNALRAVPPDERPTLREGYFFGPDVADVFRYRITGMLLRYENTPPNLAATMNAEQILAPSITLGEPLPWGVGKKTFAWLFATLPVLPEELEYRLVARHLVLLDVHANVVVDVLRDAVPIY